MALSLKVIKKEIKNEYLHLDIAIISDDKRQYQYLIPLNDSYRVEDMFKYLHEIEQYGNKRRYHAQCGKVLAALKAYEAVEKRV